jgi:hypothetical protein
MSPRRAFWLAVLAGAATAAGLAGAACLDITPIVYEAPSKGDGNAPMPDVTVGEAGPMTEGSVRDATFDGDVLIVPEVVVPPTCLGCLNWPDDAAPPGCAAELAVCMTNPKCAATYSCCVASGCFATGSFRGIVNCGIPCAEDAGIVSSNDPAVQLIDNIATCATCNCNVICGLGDSGLGTCGD